MVGKKVLTFKEGDQGHGTEKMDSWWPATRDDELRFPKEDSAYYRLTTVYKRGHYPPPQYEPIWANAAELRSIMYRYQWDAMSEKDRGRILTSPGPRSW